MYLQQFQDFEVKHNLLNEQIDGFYFWGYMRVSIYRELEAVIMQDTVNSSVEANKLSRWGYVRFLLRCVKNSVTRNPLACKNVDIVVLNHDRRQYIDGKYEAVFVDELLLRCDKYCCIDRFTAVDHKHFKTIATKKVYYDDFFFLMAKWASLFGKDSAPLRKRLKEVLSLLEQEFEVKLEHDLVSICMDEYKKAKARKKWYLRLLKKANPRHLLVVCYYDVIKMPAIEAAKQLGVQVVELQHSAIDGTTIGYNYSNPECRPYLPDKIFLYSNYWKKATKAFLPEEALVGVGHPFLERMLISRAAQLEESKDKVAVLVVGSPMRGKILADWVVNLYKCLVAANIDFAITYKLHPKDCIGWREQNPSLVIDDQRLSVVDTATASIYDYFATHSIVLGIATTVFYEALSFGLQAYVIKADGYMAMQELIDSGNAKMVDTPEQLVSAVLSGRGDRKIQENKFLVPCGVENMLRELNM